MNRIVSSCLAVIVLASSPLAMAQPDKSPAIAVAATGNTATAAVGSQLGRSPFFLMFDTKGAFVAAAANPYKDAGNAGIPAIDFLASKGVKVAVAEGFGPQIVNVMAAKGIRPLEFKGTAKDAASKAAGLK